LVNEDEQEDVDEGRVDKGCDGDGDVVGKERVVIFTWLVVERLFTKDITRAIAYNQPELRYTIYIRLLINVKKEKSIKIGT
jgi:hypothetical protein